MAHGYTYYDGLTRWFIREQIGWGLRERYEVQELPPKLLTLVRKLDAAEGNTCPAMRHQLNPAA